ncbi:STAS domain-containing protein [Caballeronia sp. NK8]|uniref:SulP family inorganic anion transporter n=1 Tax=Caballeronia sp. NK8 TaxID=140098 RepID=UPI001BB4F753|nr:SulP family inorganic anion transporter [Caballeronia sp. NK8]BCQ26190.1 STAS domain-containing protein [Caballeronia sp. NK8]
MNKPVTGNDAPRIAAPESRIAWTREILAGIVTSLALIPEVISFAFVSGVEPRSALFASVVLLVVTSLFGGRPAMVTAAAGSVALVVGPMAHANGAGYILPAVLLAALIQVAFGLLGLARIVRFIPRSVMLGFVNALGILIFWAQIPHLVGQPPAVYVLFALTLAIVLIGPRVTRAVPAPLVAIIVTTLIAVGLHWAVPTVGGDRPMPSDLPGLTAWTVPFDFSTLKIVWKTAVSIAFVGLLESLLTAKLVDEMTETRSRKSRESWALGLANLGAGAFGGVAGCAMIGQTVVNVSIGGARTRVSTLAAAATLLLLITGLSQVMAHIPMIALAGVMMVVAVKTVDWHSLHPATLRRMPWMETSVMLLSVALTVHTGNLAVGVVGGVLLATVLFARRVAHVIHTVRTVADDGRSVRYEVHGPLFFGSSNDLVERFEYAIDPATVIIDFTKSQIWDASTVAALDSIQLKYRKHGVDVTMAGLDERSRAFHARLSGRLNVG